MIFGDRPRSTTRPNRPRRATWLVIASLLVFSTAGIVQAQIAGVRVTVTNEMGNDIDFDVSAYGVTGSPANQIRAGYPLDRTDNNTTINVTDYGYGYGGGTYLFYGYLRSDWNTTVQPALEYGDGATLSMLYLPLDATAVGPGGSNVFRGSFSHTYPGDGSYTLRTRLTPTGPLANFPSPGLGPISNTAIYPPVTGNPQTGTLVNDVYANARFSFRASPAATTVQIYSAASTLTLAYPQTVITMTNTEQITIGSGPEPPPSPLEIPTLGEWALGALAVLLAGCAVVLLRRR
ncbi:MAG: IPTL-CTERM sorting domain-containing protein [Acidobacteriota bacterium]